jgi:hypothetical protein
MRGQLQRQVMITIRVVAWWQRAYLSAHATKPTPGNSPSIPNGEPTAATTYRWQVDLRASSSGGHCPRHHIGTQRQSLLITFRVMAWMERALPTAHAAKPTPGNSPSIPNGEPACYISKMQQFSLRASNSGELSPCHHRQPTEGRIILPCLSPLHGVLNFS